MYSKPDLYLFCREAVSQSTQEALGQGEALGRKEGVAWPPAAARSGKVLLPRVSQ